MYGSLQNFGCANMSVLGDAGKQKLLEARNNPILLVFQDGATHALSQCFVR